MQKKYIISIDGPVILAKGEGDYAMHDIVHISSKKILGEVIKLNRDTATIQSYEDTTGLKIGEEVIGLEESLSITLGPGIISNIFDGIGRPLSSLKDLDGDFIKRGSSSISIDLNKKWHFVPTVSVGDKVSLNSILGEVKETDLITNKIMCTYKEEAKIAEIVQEGEYTVKDCIAKILTEDGKTIELNMMQKWLISNCKRWNSYDSWWIWNGENCNTTSISKMVRCRYYCLYWMWRTWK